MANYAGLHKRIARGKGKAAKVLGQPYTQMRLDSFGFTIMDRPIQVLLRRLRGGPDVEQNFYVSQVFDLTADARKLCPGDLLVEIGSYKHAQQSVPFLTRTDTNPSLPADLQESQPLPAVIQSYSPAYFVAQIRPIHKFVAVRVETFCQIRRPSYSLVDGEDAYQEAGRNSELMLAMRHGVGAFAFVEPGMITSSDVIATIPMQLEFTAARGFPHFDLPIDWPRNRWSFAAPGNWRGFTLRENDEFINPEGERFRVIAIHNPHVGPDVLQGIVEKLES